MSYIYSAALVGEYLAGCCAVTGQSARLNSIRSVGLFWYGGKTTEVCPLSRFGMTSEHLTDDYGKDVLTWWLEDFLAKTSVSPETEPVLLVQNRPSGSKCSVSFGKYDRSTCSWKTPTCLFAEGLTLSLAAWPRAGTMRNGLCWVRATLEHHTAGNDAGFSVMFPTPTVNGNNNRKGLSKTSGDGLATRVGGMLNPAWVEWLMGLPIDWTAFGRSATPKFPFAPPSHGTFCSKKQTNERRQ